MHEDKLVTLDDIRCAKKVISESPLGVNKTPLLQNMTSFFPSIDQSIDLSLKLENMQTTGSFKLRGVANQMAHLPGEVRRGDKLAITMSAGNYGKAFAYALNKLDLSGICIMPLTAPSSRVKLIKEFGIKVEQTATADIQKTVDKYVKENGCNFLHSFDDLSLVAGYGSYYGNNCKIEMYLSSEIERAIHKYEIQEENYFCHSYDDKILIAGCGSIALEILELGVKPDIVLVCCGGGGLVSGIAAGLKLSGLSDCRIYAVEPEGAPCMYESFKKGEAVSLQTVNTIAAGLAPPYAGKLTYKHCKEFVEDVLLVSDQEIIDSMNLLFHKGFVAEPSGCAAMAALVNNKIPDVANKKVVVVITGGNVTPEELAAHLR